MDGVRGVTGQNARPVKGVDLRGPRVLRRHVGNGPVGDGIDGLAVHGQGPGEQRHKVPAADRAVIVLRFLQQDALFQRPVRVAAVPGPVPGGAEADRALGLELAHTGGQLDALGQGQGPGGGIAAGVHAVDQPAPDGLHHVGEKPVIPVHIGKGAAVVQGGGDGDQDHGPLGHVGPGAVAHQNVAVRAPAHALLEAGPLAHVHQLAAQGLQVDRALEHCELFAGVQAQALGGAEGQQLYAPALFPQLLQPGADELGEACTGLGQKLLLDVTAGDEGVLAAARRGGSRAGQQQGGEQRSRSPPQGAGSRAWGFVPLEDGNTQGKCLLCPDRAW